MQVSNPAVQYMTPIRGTMKLVTLATITNIMATTAPKAIHILRFRTFMEPAGDKVRGVNPNGEPVDTTWVRLRGHVGCVRWLRYVGLDSGIVCSDRLLGHNVSKGK